jgi:hypothetical protein
MGVPMQPGAGAVQVRIIRKYTEWVLVVLMILCWPLALIYYFTREKATVQEIAPYAMPMSVAPMAAPPVASPPPMAPAPGGAPVCPRCGRPATWLPQYNRYYCSTDQQYL